MTRRDLYNLLAFAALATAVVGCAHKPDEPEPQGPVTELGKVNASLRTGVDGARDDIRRAKEALKR